MSIHHDYPIPAASSKAQCFVYGCENVASVLVVIRMPHSWLFDRSKWGAPGDIEHRAPGSATVSFCTRCARRMAIGVPQSVPAESEGSGDGV